MDEFLSDSLTMVGDAGFTLDALKFFAQCVGYVAVGLTIVFVFKQYLDWRSKHFDDDHAIEVEGNNAFALRRGALYLALFLGMAGSRLSPRTTYLHDLGVFFADSVAVAVGLVIVCWVTDLYLLRRTPNMAELAAGNWAVAVVESSAGLSIGLIFNGSFAGEGGGLLSALQFVGIAGLVTFPAIYLIRDSILAADVEEELRSLELQNGEFVKTKEGNVALGIETGGFMLGMALIQRASIIGPFEGWWQDTAAYLETLVAGLAVMALATWLIDVVFLRRTSLRGTKHHGNLAASMVVAGISVGAAYLVSVTI